jgi:hypothetical protein
MTADPFPAAELRAKPDYAPPYRVEVYDHRVMIVCEGGASICEVMPGQVNGYQATKEERITLAQRIVDAVNNPVPDDCPTPFVCGLKTEPARSPDAPWLKPPVCGETEDGA